MSNGDASPPPYQHGYSLTPPPAQQPQRGTRIVVAALLVGALAGGAAGFSGAALLQETSAHNAASLSEASSTSGLNLAPDTSAPGSATATDADAETAAANVLPSVVKIYATSSTESASGSGIVLTSSGQILTNNHVVELAVGGGSLAVSSRTVAPSLLNRGPRPAHGPGCHPGQGGRQRHSRGDRALGGPEGRSTGRRGRGALRAGEHRHLRNRERAESAGDHAGEARQRPRHGVPGHPDRRGDQPGQLRWSARELSGQVVGINSAIQTASDSSSGQGGSIGLGFAIPIDEALLIAEQLRNTRHPPMHASASTSPTSPTSSDCRTAHRSRTSSRAHPRRAQVSRPAT